MRPIQIAPLVVVALLVGACGASSASPAWTYSPPASRPAAASTDASTMPSPAAQAMPTAVAPASAPAATATRIEVTLTDLMKIEPGTMTVPAGRPVTFVVTNRGSVLHEFTLGDAADQAAHDQEMMAAGGMSMPKDEKNAIGVQPGQTKELVFTFAETGETLAGCHVIGHYAAGMKAAITIE